MKKKLSRWESCFPALHTNLFPSYSETVIVLLTYMHPHFCQSYLAAGICTTALVLRNPTQSSGGMDDCLPTALTISLPGPTVISQDQPEKEAKEALHFLSSLQHHCQSQINKHLAVVAKSADLSFASMYYIYTWIDANQPSFSKKETKIQWVPMPQFHKKTQGQDQIKFHLKKKVTRGEGEGDSSGITACLWGKQQKNAI